MINNKGSEGCITYHKPIHFSPMKKPRESTQTSISSCENIADDPNPNSTNKDIKKTAKTWSHLKLVIQAVHLFKTSEVQQFRKKDEVEDFFSKDENLSSPNKSLQISSLDCLTPQLEAKRLAQQDKDEIFINYKLQAKFFKLLQKGTLSNLEKMASYVMSDQKKHILNPSDPQLLTNKKNHIGETPLYVVCKNGYLEYVKKLLKLGADPHIESTFGNKMEGNLTVTARWNHLDVLKYLLEKVLWTKIKTKMAMESTSNLQTRKILRNYLKTKFKAKKRFFMC